MVRRSYGVEVAWMSSNKGKEGLRKKRVRTIRLVPSE